MTQGGNAYLHGSGELKYESMELTSDYIRMNIDSSQIFAQGVYDSINEEWSGKPVFNDGCYVLQSVTVMSCITDS